jgi:hypothetical protein
MLRGFEKTALAVSPQNVWPDSEKDCERKVVQTNPDWDPDGEGNETFKD